MILAFIGFNILLTAVLAPFIVFWGPFQALKVVAVGSIATSRHPQVVEAFLSQAQIDAIMHSTAGNSTGNGIQLGKEEVKTDPSDGIVIEDIKGNNFRGKVMLIKDPKRVKLVTTTQIGVAGERVSDMVKDAGAIAGINAGGFYDPDGKGNGAYPDGVTVHNGAIVHNNINEDSRNMVGLDANGKLILGDVKASEVAEKGIREGISFEPNLVVDGKGVVQGDGGWGMAPRTAIGQKADGTIIFVVIDGRQPTWSMGAWLRDLMNIFLDYGAVNACNLDGGSSSEMVYDGKVINKLWNVFGERYIPTAFVVMPNK